MIGLYVAVPVACWRRGHAREYLETWDIPPPSTAYGFLLSLVGEEDRRAHIGARVATGVIGEPPVSRVLRTLWRWKDKTLPSGVGTNACPDWQEVVTQAEVVVWVDRGDESGLCLEDRVRGALADPRSVRRFGGLSLGESTHLVDEARELRSSDVQDRPLTAMVRSESGDRAVPVWVDHVGSRDTRYLAGSVTGTNPTTDQLFAIAP